jgi:uncharacterized membrane protein YdjX (TVP38/TMEM64 family)
MNRHNIKKLTIALRIVVIAAFLFWIAPRINMVSAENVTASSLPLPLVIFAFFILYALKAVVMILPVNVLYISAGMIFPAAWGILITYIGLAIALGVGYFNGKELGEDKVSETLAKHKKAASFLDSRRNLTSMCFIARLLPLPKDLFSMFFGAVGMPFYKYVVISLLGLSPVMISSVIAGAYFLG